MNKRQKILTIVAMVAFSVIVALHYGRFYPGDYPHTERRWRVYTDFKVTTVEPISVEEHHFRLPSYSTWSPAIQDVRVPLFALAVFYTGFFFLLATPKGKQ
jgi:hypothetical protein